MGAIESFRRGAQSGAKWVPDVDLCTLNCKKKMFRGLSLCVNPQAGKESSLSLKDELHIGTRFFLHNKENQRPDVPWTMGIDGIFSIDFLATKSNPITCELFFGGEI